MKRKYSQSLADIQRINQRVIAQGKQPSNKPVGGRSSAAALNDSDIKKAWSNALNQYEKTL